jgi:hypothetical protein
VASHQTIRRHRAGENPDGRPAPDLVRAYRAPGAVVATAPATPVVTAR